jgi:hypothetical protein
MDRQSEFALIDAVPHVVQNLFDESDHPCSGRLMKDYLCRSSGV